MVHYCKIGPFEIPPRHRTPCRGLEPGTLLPLFALETRKGRPDSSSRLVPQQFHGTMGMSISLSCVRSQVALVRASSLPSCMRPTRCQCSPKYARVSKCRGGIAACASPRHLTSIQRVTSAICVHRKAAPKSWQTPITWCHAVLRHHTTF